MDTSQYLDLFIDETKEHLQSLNEHVLVLGKGARRMKIPSMRFSVRHIR